jgi:hypothetical protein
MNSDKASYSNPFLWVPSSYLVMGLIYVTVGSVANVMFKNMGMSNTSAAFWSSLLGFNDGNYCNLRITNKRLPNIALASAKI